MNKRVTGRAHPAENDGGKTEDAYNKLRAAITYGDLKPGQPLVADAICKMLDVGRTPLREALRQLKTEGYVDLIPNKGAVVTSYSKDDVMAIYDVISVLEAHAAGLAATRIEMAALRGLTTLQREIRTLSFKREYRTWLERNDVFHSRIIEQARNPHLKKTVDGLRDKIYRYRYIAIKFPGHLEQCVQDHEVLLKALAARNPTKAGAAMKEHVLHSRDVLLDFLEVA